LLVFSGEDAVKYVSTRGKAPVLEFDDALLGGLARDGGLYLPDSWPLMSVDDIRALKGLSYTELAYEIIKRFVGDTVAPADLKKILTDAYSDFDAPDVAPVKKIGDNEYLLELFHGPTLAFKDMAMQFLGPMFDHVLKAKNQRVTIVGATSGDTGSAAIEACRDRDAIDIFILYPDGRVSDVQRRQMTTVDAANVHCIAVDGTFDDCQDMVKALFNDTVFRDSHNLSAVNSINWARIVAQIVYYFWAALKTGAPESSVAFSVPTGNFGNVFAGYAASRMGLPVSQFIIGSNSNDILTRFFDTGEMTMDGVSPTISPSMDIQVSSNFERLLFELYDRDGDQVSDLIEGFRKTGSFAVDDEHHKRATDLIDGARFDDEQTMAMINTVKAECGELLDPHTAVGVAAARAKRRDAAVPMIALATAHPAKFPDAVEKVSGVTPELPDALSDLHDRAERFERLPNDIGAVQDFIVRTLNTKKTDGAAA
jgi:threonine synthase